MKGGLFGVLEDELEHFAFAEVEIREYLRSFDLENRLRIPSANI